jgi:hypothetical protein
MGRSCKPIGNAGHLEQRVGAYAMARRLAKRLDLPLKLLESPDREPRPITDADFPTGIPEPPPVPVDEELEATIKQLIARKDAAREGSAEYRMIVRQLIGIREFSQLGRLIIEDFEMRAELFLPREIG